MHRRDPDCIFCRIVSDELPSCKLYTAEHAVAFLDIAPFETGHTLVISKYHARHLTDLPTELLKEVIATVQLVAAHLKESLPCDGFNILQNNGACATQVVPHLHFHIIPRWNGRRAQWHSLATPPSGAELDALCQRLQISAPETR